MCPLACSAGFDAVWLFDKLVPGVTAMIDDFGIGSEDAVGEPVIPHELPADISQMAPKRRPIEGENAELDGIAQPDFGVLALSAAP